MTEIDDAAPPVSPHGRWRQWLKAEWLLLLFGALAVGLAVLDPQPLASSRRWLQLPTLTGLFGLLIAIQGIRDSGVVQRAGGGARRTSPFGAHAGPAAGGRHGAAVATRPIPFFHFVAAMLPVAAVIMLLLLLGAFTW